MFKDFTDDQLVDLIITMDRLEKPLAQRFDGDDDSIVQLMEQLGFKQTIVDKLLISGLVMREALTRGIIVPRLN